MPDADPQLSGALIPGESINASPVIPTAGKSPVDHHSSSADYFRPPRLGILHIMAFIAFATGLIVFYTFLEMLNPRPDHSDIGILRQALQIIRNLVTAASWVGLVILLAGKIRRTPARLQPGHWILMFESIFTLLALLFWGIIYLGQESNYHGSNLLMILMGYESFFMLLAYALLIYLLRERISWKVLFGVLAVFHGALGVFYFSQGMRIWWFSHTQISLPLDIVVLFVLIVTVAIDWKNYSSRDWLHWLGLFLIGYGVSISIVWSAIHYMTPGFL